MKDLFVNTQLPVVTSDRILYTPSNFARTSLLYLQEIGSLQVHKADSYVFGFEESYGYLTGSYVRDKDGVDGAYMICEMFSYYATQGISLLDKLDELYKTYGYCLNTLHSYEFDGSAGFARMQSIMQAFRGGIKEFGGKKVVRLLDYVQGLDVIRFINIGSKQRKLC